MFNCGLQLNATNTQVNRHKQGPVGGIVLSTKTETEFFLNSLSYDLSLNYSLQIAVTSCLTLQIITTDEAERRGHVYDRQGSTYLFDLDYVEDVYTVDAAHQGNISHFVNHSVSVFSTYRIYWRQLGKTVCWQDLTLNLAV